MAIHNTILMAITEQYHKQKIATDIKLVWPYFWI